MCSRFRELALNSFGTRIIQKYIETTNETSDIFLLQSLIEPNIKILMVDQYGYHVVLKALFTLDKNHCQYIGKFLKQNMLQIANSRQGCCAIQKIIEEPEIPFKSQFIAKIVKLTSKLIIDSQGHYVLNCVIGLKNDKINLQIIDKLADENELVSLCRMKYPTYVIERLLDSSSLKLRNRLIKSILAATKDILGELSLELYGGSSKFLINSFSNFEDSLLCNKGGIGNNLQCNQF